jgi:hypothetical protein
MRKTPRAAEGVGECGGGCEVFVDGGALEGGGGLREEVDYRWDFFDCVGRGVSDARSCGGRVDGLGFSILGVWRCDWDGG